MSKPGNIPDVLQGRWHIYTREYSSAGNRRGWGGVEDARPVVLFCPCSKALTLGGTPPGDRRLLRFAPQLGRWGSFNPRSSAPQPVALEKTLRRRAEKARRLEGPRACGASLLDQPGVPRAEGAQIVLALGLGLSTSRPQGAAWPRSPGPGDQLCGFTSPSEASPSRG